MTAVAIRLDRLDQLVQDAAPSPFGPPRLTQAAAAFLAARAMAEKRAPVLDISVAQGAEPTADVALVSAALRGEAEAAAAALAAQEREARRTLVVGLAVLVASLTVAALPLFGSERRVLTLIQESLVILGWVGLWRPADTYLYDLPASRRHRDLWHRLAGATVTVRKDQPAGGAAV